MNENEMLTCAVCGAEFPADKLTAVHNGDLVCEDCLEEFVTCDECGELFHRDEVTWVDDDTPVCEACLDAEYFHCEHCGEYHKLDEANDVKVGWHSHETWCNPCVWDDAFYCDGCEQYYSLSDYDYHESPSGDTYCEDCFSDSCCVCEHCGTTLWREDAYWSDYLDGWLCEDCYDEEGHRRVIHDYGYKPSAEFHTRKGVYSSIPADVKDLFFGIEDECDKGDDASATAEKIQDITDALYIKHDGSLDCGFEMVTHPCTLAYHMYEMPWKHICKTALSGGFKSHDARTCGLHVHVGVAQMSDNRDEQDSIVARIVLLVDRHWDALVKFSRRNSNQLRWAERPQLSHTNRPVDRWEQDALDTVRDGRYQAVNLTNRNRNNTIEFRLFNGTLKRDTIIATLQFLNNLCKYAMTHTTEEALASSFTDIVSVEGFKELKTYLEERNLTEVDDPAPAEVLTFGDAVNPEIPLQVGDRVQCINVRGGGVADEVLGITGTVAAVYDNFRAGTYNIGVILDDTLAGFGHMLEDIADRTINGYYFHTENLIRING